jgi:uncharacterized protein YodC (DUF2158 family)
VWLSDAPSRQLLSNRQLRLSCLRRSWKERASSSYLLLTGRLHSGVVDQEQTMQFRVGDVVYLISYPSHRMTVVEVDGSEIACRWFERAVVKEGTFPAHLIAKEVQDEAVEAPA